jgi:hypothetical protein
VQASQAFGSEASGQGQLQGGWAGQHPGMVQGTRTGRHRSGQMARPDGEQHPLPCQIQAAEILQGIKPERGGDRPLGGELEGNGGAIRHDAIQHQQRDPAPSASRLQLAMNATGEGVGGIDHSPKGEAGAPGILQRCRQNGRPAEGTHPHLQARIWGIAASTGSGDHTQPQRPALGEQSPGQRRAVTGAAEQPKSTGLPVVERDTVHQDGGQIRGVPG